MKFFTFLSMRMLGIYFLLFAMVCGIATFVEHYYSTQIAKTAIYNTLWFELIFVISALALLYNIVVFKLYKKERIAIGLFHIAFVIIILGAGITRYVGEDGQMHIREGQEVDFFISRNNGKTEKIDIPFSLQLKKFAIEYYPGSDTPSEYRSQVRVIEDSKFLRTEEIYMNHILKHKGYRFFQSSYDQDLKGTILSVNHDPFGMWTSYTGYALMFIGMILSLFSKGSRFYRLSKSLSNKTTVLLILCSVFSYQSIKAETLSNETINTFSELWTSNGKGRIHPVHTLNQQLLQKLSHERTLDEKSADEVILNILVFPEEWKNKPLILIDNESLIKTLSLSSEMACYNDFFTTNGEFILMKELEKAYHTDPAKQNKLDKKLIATTEKVSIFKMIVEGTFLNVYPDLSNPNQQWLNPQQVNLGDNEKLVHNNRALKQAIFNQSNKELQQAFNNITEYQKELVADILPNDNKKALEILYNKFNLFTRLAPTYATLAILLLIVSIVNITSGRDKSKFANFLIGAVTLTFIIHTIGLGMRWYISGHAPMSNGYESMLIVSWASILGGLAFVKKSTITLAISTILAGATLLVAHINSMNPEITALVPVLNSNWLSIHVATITASYGFLSVCALLGLFNITAIAFTKKESIQRTITELTTVSQMLMIIGLYLLCIGCFIGAVWANESWGRYWSWDPKETWCLITIIIYAFIIHMHHIPALSSKVAYNTAAIWGIASILMTYFGVNYFLGGMHSYGKGEANSINISYFFIAFILLAINTKALTPRKSIKNKHV